MRAEPALVLALAALLDATLGEPPNALHPVVWMGHAIAPLKRLSPRGAARELAIGALYVALISGGFAAAAWVVLQLANGSTWMAFAIQVYLLWSCFALKGLLAAGGRMLGALQAGELGAAREALASLCSRDPAELSSEELAGATIESLSENLSDSVVAPLFYYVLFGVPGAVFYRAANTLDAMVGYRGRYEYLGKVAARLDDALNFVPARLSALCLLATGSLLGMPARRALGIYTRDAALTESPNAGRPMAMAAGLLGVRLDKRCAYTLGAELAAPDGTSLARSLTLVRWAGWLALALLGLALAGWPARALTIELGDG